MRVLITGATGFLGAHLCRRMAEEGHDVRILCRVTSNLTTLEGLPVERVTGDVTDPDSVRRAVRGREWVVHAAANLSYWGRDQTAQMQVNVGGTRHVAQACRLEGVARLVHISSVAAIGIPTDPQRPANEDFPFNLESSGLTYHLSKRRAEEAIIAEVLNGLEAVIVNPAMLLGPTQGSYRGLRQIEKIMRHWLIPYVPGGLCIVHVSDAVHGIILALQQGHTGERYILGGDNVSFLSLSEMVYRHLALTRLLIPVPAVLVERVGRARNSLGRLLRMRPLPIYDRRFCYQFYDSTKAKVQFGYNPRPLLSIIEECVAHSRPEIRKPPGRQCGS